MAVSAFNLGGGVKLRQAEYKEFNAWSGGTGSCTFTAESSGIAVFAIFGNVAYFISKMNVNGQTVAYSRWDVSTAGDGEAIVNRFAYKGYDCFYARQYQHGFATKQIKVKKGDSIYFTSSGQADGGDDGKIQIAMYIVKG